MDSNLNAKKPSEPAARAESMSSKNASFYFGSSPFITKVLSHSFSSSLDEGVDSDLSSTPLTSSSFSFCSANFSNNSIKISSFDLGTSQSSLAYSGKKQRLSIFKKAFTTSDSSHHDTGNKFKNIYDLKHIKKELNLLQQSLKSANNNNNNNNNTVNDSSNQQNYKQLVFSRTQNK